MAKREDLLKNSWAYQEIWQEGVREEQLAELLRQRQLLERFVQIKFPNSLEMAKERGKSITEPKVFYDVLLKIFIAQTEEEVMRILDK